MVGDLFDPAPSKQEYFDVRDSTLGGQGLFTRKEVRATEDVGLLYTGKVLRQGKEDGEAIFTRYARSRGADSASQMLMKRLRKVVKDPKKTIHSLRHSMKDSLRNGPVTV